MNVSVDDLFLIIGQKEVEILMLKQALAEAQSTEDIPDA